MPTGSFAIFDGGPSNLVVPTLNTYTNVDIGTQTINDDGIVVLNSNVFNPKEPGYYLILATGRIRAEHLNRLNVSWKIFKNGTALEGTAGSGYARDLGNAHAYMKCGTIAYFNGTTDTFEVKHMRDTGAGTVVQRYMFTHLKIVKLGDVNMPFGHYGQPTSGAYTGTVATPIPGWQAFNQTDTSVIELQAGGTDIQLKQKNRPYLIIYSLVNSDAGSTRTTRVSDVTIDGVRVPHSAGYTYQRDAANQYGHLFGVALVYPTVVNQNINIRCWGYDNTLSTAPIQFNNGSWTLSSAVGDSGISVIALPTTTDISIFDDRDGGDPMSGLTDNDVTTQYDVNSVTSPTVLKLDDTTVRMGVSTNIFAFAGFMIERTVNNPARSIATVQWLLNNTATPQAYYGTYVRGDQSTQDTKNGATLIDYVGAVAISDTFKIERFRISEHGPGTNDWDKSSFAGAFFINLATLTPVATGINKFLWNGDPVTKCYYNGVEVTKSYFNGELVYEP